MKQEEPLLTTDEVARYLRVNKYTVYRLVTERKLPAFKIGNQWRFKQSVIERWIRKKMNVPPSH